MYRHNTKVSSNKSYRSLSYINVLQLLRHIASLYVYNCKTTDTITILHGLVVRIPGFHPGGPGSIPGVGTFYFYVGN